MPSINTETVYTVELTEEDLRKLSGGEPIEVDLPAGDVMRLVGTGEANTALTSSAGTKSSPAPVREGVEAGSEDDVSPEEIEKLVKEGKQQKRKMKGAEPGGGIISKE